MSGIAPTTRMPVSTQCEYESWNKTTNCWNYRSCAQCLEKDGCMVGVSGACQSSEGATNQHDYVRASTLNLILPAAKDTMNDSMKRETQAWQFPASEAAYCKRDDAVCQQCIQEEFWHRNFGRDSRFCVGLFGCVCIMNCEFTTLTPACGDAYVITETIPPATRLPSPTLDSVASPASGSPPVLELDCRVATKDPITGCYMYRTCRDCLDTLGCRIGVAGRCERDIASNGQRDSLAYDIAIARNWTLPAARTLNISMRTAEQTWHFPASQLQYCPANDSVCSECVREKYWLDPGVPTDSRFCVGESTSTSGDKCVCISNCDHNESRTYCPRSPNDHFQKSSADDFPGLGTIPLLVILTLLVLVVLAVCSCLSVCRKRRAQKRESTQPPIARVVASDEVVPDEDASASMYVVVHLPSQDIGTRT